MKLIRLSLNIGLCYALYLFISCSEAPIETDLSSINSGTDTLLITEISGFNYQISPDIGNYDKLYLGSKDDFSFLSSLFNFSLSSWNTFSDSAVIIDSIFFKVFSGDSLFENNPLINLHFSEDSIFDESISLVSELNDVSFDNWVDLGMPFVDAMIDTSDSVASFQQTVLKWDLGMILETIIDTSILYRTLSLSLPSESSSFFELYSREYNSGSLDPKIEVYYRKEIGTNPDSSIMDTLTRIIYVAEDISIIEALEIDNYDDDILISRARGSRAILNVPFDSLDLPQYSVIHSAKLHLFQPNDSLVNFKVIMNPLKFLPDSISTIYNADPYENLGIHSSSASIVSNKLEISLKAYLQSLSVTDSLKNVGFKLNSSSENDLFESVNFDLNHNSNRLEIFYVSP